MAHEIEGNKAFYLTTPAWHGLGTVLTEAPSVADAWKLAYPHNLIECDLVAKSGDVVADEIIPDKKAIYRDDGKYIATVGKDYGLVQPFEAFDFFQPWIDSGEVELEAGGSLREGTRMWALASIKNTEQDVVKNDTVKGHFLVFTSFDGSLAHGIKFCATRVVCANTLAIALRENSAGINLKHTSKIKDRIAKVQETVSLARKTFDSSIEAYKALASKKVTHSQVQSYVRNVFVTDDTPISPRTDNQIRHVVDLTFHQKNAELVPAIQGTAWQAYNSVSEYITHEFGRTEDSRLNGQWFGDSAKMNQRALQAAFTM